MRSYGLFLGALSIALSAAGAAAQTPAANTVAWHGVVYDASKAADKLMADFKLTPPTSWPTLDAKGKLDELFKARKVAVPTLFNSINDRVDMALNDLAKAASVNRDELTAIYLLETLDPPVDSKGFQLDTLYVLLREFKNTVASLKIYAAILDKTLKSESIEEVKAFLRAFPQVPDVSAVQGRLFLLVDGQAISARTKQDFSTCFNLYKAFNKIEGIQPALLQLSMERIDAVMLEFIATKVADPASQWKGHLMTPEERVKACEGYISQFADSKERVEYVASVASTVQLNDWRKQREAIDETDAMAAAKISSLLLDIGNQGFNAFDSASDLTNGLSTSQRLVLTYRAARASAAIRDAAQNPNSNINKQFPTNATARNAALVAITQANNNLILTKISSQLTDIHTQLLKQVELLDKIVINTDELNKKVAALSTELATGFASVKTSLDAVQANLVTLNKTAEETLKVTREGFTSVNAHLAASNQKLDELVGQVKVSNGLLTKLNTDLNSGFESVKQTIVDVSNKDFTNVGFFGSVLGQAGNAISEGAQHISDEVSSWF